jgi:hypothetical protein
VYSIFDRRDCIWGERSAFRLPLLFVNKVASLSHRYLRQGDVSVRKVVSKTVSPSLIQFSFSPSSKPCPSSDEDTPDKPTWQARGRHPRPMRHHRPTRKPLALTPRDLTLAVWLAILTLRCPRQELTTSSNNKANSHHAPSLRSTTPNQPLAQGLRKLSAPTVATRSGRPWTPSPALWPSCWEACSAWPGKVTFVATDKPFHVLYFF